MTGGTLVDPCSLSSALDLDLYPDLGLKVLSPDLDLDLHLDLES